MGALHPPLPLLCRTHLNSHPAVEIFIQLKQKNLFCGSKVLFPDFSVQARYFTLLLLRTQSSKVYLMSFQEVGSDGPRALQKMTKRALVRVNLLKKYSWG